MVRINSDPMDDQVFFLSTILPLVNKIFKFWSKNYEQGYERILLIFLKGGACCTLH